MTSQPLAPAAAGGRLCPLDPFRVPRVVLISCRELPSFMLSEIAT